MGGGGDGLRELTALLPERDSEPLYSWGPRVPLTEHIPQHPVALLGFSNWDW